MLPQFREKKPGMIVYIDSFGGWVGEPGTGVCSGTNFAIKGYERIDTSSYGPLLLTREC